MRRVAGRVSRPDRAAQRRITKEIQRQRKEQAREDHRNALEQAMIRQGRNNPLRPTLIFPRPEPEETPLLQDERACYICKKKFREVHFFYDQLCIPCAEFNFSKRSPKADLSGRVAVVTGARVKIGYQASLMLLRSGCKVLATTRFPRDAATRYASEPDFSDWGHRLEVHGLDLRHAPSVVSWCEHQVARLERLDFLLNNACQTVRRPSGFYAHLLEAERKPVRALTDAEQAVLGAYEQLRALPEAQEALTVRGLDVGLLDPAALSQVPLMEEDRKANPEWFPAGRLDGDLQQVDLREKNSWRLTLAEVPAAELFEVQLVNAIAPFLLNKGLKPLMVRVPTNDKHIVNVSAMEGQFYRMFKTDKHPHTNMAKAALNMMTRTSAPDYARDGIHMNSVDTGWITDEDSAAIAERKRAELDFHPPLDAVDGAARIVDPIFHGFQTGEHRNGQFLKDYHPAPW